MYVVKVADAKKTLFRSSGIENLDYLLADLLVLAEKSLKGPSSTPTGDCCFWLLPSYR